MKITGCLILLAWLLTACNMPSQESKLNPTLNVTQAYQTVQAKLTLAALTTPSSSSTPILPAPEVSPSPQPPSAQTPLLTNTPAQPSITLTPSCDQAAASNPIDVTIPDDTAMEPGQRFTKVWRLRNVGTCTWNTSYAIAFFSGEQMGAPASVPLPGKVAPGQSVDLAVDLIAPQDAGTHQGNWKLRNAASVLFGIGPNSSSPFWVRIMVIASPTPTPTQMPPTPTPSPSPTPHVLTSGVAAFNVGNELDLDTNVFGGPGSDLAFVLNTDGDYFLSPLHGAQVLYAPSTNPGIEECQTLNLLTTPLVLEEETIGRAFCYLSDQNSPGRALITAFDPGSGTLSLDIVTWVSP